MNSQSKQKEDWPVTQLAREHGSDVIETLRPGKVAATRWEYQTYLPESALLSEEANRAARQALEGANPMMPRESWMQEALKAAIAATKKP